MSTIKYVKSSPVLLGESDLDCYKRVSVGTFLEQELVPVIDDKAPSTLTFSAHITSSHASLVEGLLHEIGHAIQLKKAEYPRRLKSWSAQIFVKPAESVTEFSGQRFYEPSSSEPTVRECETIAIQLHLAELLGYKIDLNKYITNWARILDNGSLGDFVARDKRRKMAALLIRGFYLGWDSREELMARRFKNYCEYVSKNLLQKSYHG